MSIQDIASTLLGFERSQFFAFKADNHPESTFHVVDFSVEEGLSTPFTIQLTLASANNQLTEDDIVDKYGVLTLYKNQLVERYFHGVVFSFARGDTGRHHTFYTVTLVPEFARLSLRTNSRIFQGKSVVDITEELLKEMNITNYALALRHNHEPREFCVQYCESDEEFIERLLAEEGIFYYFEHSKDNHTIVFADDNSVVDEIPFPCLYNTNAGGVADTSYIRRLESIAKVKPTDAVLNDYSFKQPSNDFKKSAFGNHADYQSQYEHYMYPGRYKDHQVGTAFTKTRIDYFRSDAKTIKGQSDIAQLTSGYLMKIEEHPTIQTNQEWLTVMVKHQGQQPQSLENAGGVGLTKYHNTFYALPKQQQWKPKPEPKPHIYGPQIAKVVGPADEEIYTDEFGRVKVQFPWDRYGQSDDKSSCWIRVSQDWAGAGYGGIMIPRIGHEVIVSFLEGDPDQPIVTGRGYHATNRQPYKLPEHKTITGFKTKTHKGEGYNELYFDDENEKQLIRIHAEKDYDLKVKNVKNERIDFDHQVSIGNDQKTDIANNRTLTVEGEQHHTTKGNHFELREFDSNLEIRGDFKNHIKSNYTIKVDDIFTLESNKQITLKVGASFIVIEKDAIYINSPLVGINNGGAPANTKMPADPNILETLSGIGMPFIPYELAQPYSVRFHFTDDNNIAYRNTPYIATLEDGSKINGVTNKEGYTETFYSNKEEDVLVHLILKHQEKEKPYSVSFHFTDDAGIPYKKTNYIATLEDGSELKGKTDENGYTETFYGDKEEKISVHLILNNT